MYKAKPGAHQLLDGIFASDFELPPPSITLGALARVFGVTVSRLEPFALEGYLKLQSQPPLTSRSYVESPPEAAITWMRGWFQPMRAKPLWSLDDVAELLEVKAKAVLEKARANGIPVVHDPALGFTFSMMAVRALLVQDVGRYDRQALLWRLSEGDPRRPKQLPKFEQEWERELERVSKLEEPVRTTRRADLMSAWLDAQGMWEAYRSSSESGRAE